MMGGATGGISALGTGFMQGYGQAQQLRENAMKLKMQQLQLDDEKRRLMGEAALFAHISGLQGQGQDPGQPPQGGAPPMQQGGAPMGGPQPDAMQPPAQPQGGQPQPQAPNPYAAPQGGGPGGAPAMPPGMSSQPAQPPQQPAPAPSGGPQPQGQPQQQDSGQFDVFSQYQSVLKVANDIQTRYSQANGGKKLDPATLLSATERALKLMQGLAPAQRLQLIDTANNLRAQVQERGQDVSAANTEARVGAQIRGQDVGAASRQGVADTQAESREKVEAGRERTAERGQDIRSADTQRGQDISSADRKASRDASMQRAQMVQTQLNQRFAQGQGDKTRLQAQLIRSREIVAQMNAAQRIMNGIELAKPGVKPENDAQYAAAVKSYEDAQTKLNILEKQSNVEGAAGPTGGTPKVGDIVQGRDGKKYRVTGGDPNDPDVEEVP